MAFISLYHQYHWFLILFVVLVLLFGSETALSDSFKVESLPGFDGSLPFQLETGYVGVDEENDKQLFYYFFNSERNPEEDPLVLWLTGGPRCSGLSALAFEIGPIYFKDAEMTNGDVPSLVLNPNSWTKVANIIFLDAPIGTGFSYSKTGQEGNMSDTISAHDTYEFLRNWFIDYPQFLSNPLYICGDSFSGIIIPILLQELISGIEAGKEPLFNFKGYLIGNPVTDKHLELNTQVPFARGMGLISYELHTSLQRNCKGEYVNIDSSNTVCLNDYKAFLKWKSGVNTNQVLEPVCFDFLAKENISSDNKLSLGIKEPVLRRLGYELSAKEKNSGDNKLSLNDKKTILRNYNCRQRKYPISEIWANDHRVQKALNVRQVTNMCNFHGIPDNPDYGVPYYYNVNSSIAYHQNINTKGYRSLIYSGDHDMEVPHISTETWIRLLGSSIVDDWHWWIVDDQVAGYTRTYSNGLTYATVKGGGHTSPEQKPKECFEMFKRWIFNNPL
ncbi:hypothetical protein AQUCO_04500188v1 [Aquilegia coerulea]|uniref:Uncharacterized protein n=1 Tax=Aquilegia coerulea TaxID=218851 RepID=A0A2G5CNI0_AQUCA|nr:hypothetical protein AQUCO_04500188v1 [Aquilegia coerulea]